jgi:hypothetical protein
VDVAVIHALHDRRVPATSGDIDHLVIGPAGVFVMDATRYEGQIHIRGVDSELSWSSAACRSSSWVRSLTTGEGRSCAARRCLAVRLREGEHLGHDRHSMRWRDVLCLVAVGANA